MEDLKLRNELLQVVQKVAEKNEINRHKITSVQTNDKGQGFLGEIFLIAVEDTENPDRKLNMVIKAAFQDEGIRNVVTVIKMTFENEVYFYTKLFPVLAKFAQEHGGKPADFVPKCFDVSLEDRAEYLVLENLKTQGFETISKTISFDDDHVRLIFNTYGKLHGQTFALSGQDPELVQQMGSKLHNIFKEFSNTAGFEQGSKQLAVLILNHLESSKHDTELIEKFRNNYTKSEHCPILYEASNLTEYACIVHGDCWSNNLMFKYEELENGKRRPTEIRLLDWQLLALGSPACDLSYCLYSGGSKEIYDNLDNYLKIYYDSFCETVRQLGSDPEKLYPFAVLKEQWKKFSKFGLIMAFTIWFTKFTKTEDVKDMSDLKDMDLENLNMNELVFDRERYFQAVEDVIVHMHEIGAL